MRPGNIFVLVGMFVISAMNIIYHTVLQSENKNSLCTTEIASNTDGTATSGNIFQMQRGRSFVDSNKAFSADWHSTYPDTYPNSDKWAVVTTIFKPTKTVLGLLGLPGWCTVVVADRKSVAEYKGPEGACLVYLTPERQRQLPYNILHHLQWNTFARKNVGFLFAMHHGARVIYDTDDDNEVSDTGLLQQWAKGGVHSIHTSPEKVVNPYPSFGASTVWPRGFPLDLIRESANNSTQTTQTTTGSVRCGIIQSLADVEPDVDAIYRLSPLAYPVSFRVQPYVLRVAPTSLSPFNAQATLFFQDSFHLMLLPATVHGRVSDIWRGYFAQHIMRWGPWPECRLNFVSPWVSQFRNSHSYLADFDAEIPLYLQSTALIEYLIQHVHPTLTLLFIAMYEHGIVELDDVYLAQAWEADINVIKAKMGAQGTVMQDDMRV